MSDSLNVLIRPVVDDSLALADSLRQVPAANNSLALALALAGSLLLLLLFWYRK